MVVLRKVAIYSLHNTLDFLLNYNPWIVCSVPCAKYGLGRQGFVLFEVTAYLRSYAKLASYLYSYVSDVIATFKNSCEFSLMIE